MGFKLGFENWKGGNIQKQAQVQGYVIKRKLELRNVYYLGPPIYSIR